ncbi:hypothetical protein RJ640_019348 [Escallonia rubra]|uniref:Uncharacterized protein n=1 Tax=Escallonia rubra TaxID=112253 RepID=A0AA88SGG0_9ASTE|nr:hypothetical protein RJ640_019348 [Escallonia rubra]
MEAIIAGHVINKIVSILEYRVLLEGGVNEELDELRLELDCMRSFLEDADQKKNLSEGEKTWVKTVKDMCYPIENVLDEFMYHMSKPQSRATKLRKINRKIKAISERRGRFPVQLEETRSIDDHRRFQYHGEAFSSGNDDHLVGIEGDRCLLLKWLTCDEPRRAVISVVGMGGSGKSTLVSKVYNSPVVKQHFECYAYAWIRVSPAYNIEDIFQSMIKKFHGQNQENFPIGLSSMGCQELLEMLVDYLRYIIVLDDVWARQLLDEINASLPDEGDGSRVMLKTRKHDIASSSFGVGSHVHRIKPLGDTDAWDLFRVKVFSRNPQIVAQQSLSKQQEGFVKQVQGKTPECLAQDYLMELVHRNMLQVVQRNQSGRPKACKMHDLVGELALLESPKEFCAVYNGQEASEELADCP